MTKAYRVATDEGVVWVTPPPPPPMPGKVEQRLGELASDGAVIFGPIVLAAIAILGVLALVR